MHNSRSTTPTQTVDNNNERSPLRPTNGNGGQISDLRHPSPLPPHSSMTTSPTRQPEQTNTKKKRTSLSNHLDLNDVRGRDAGEGVTQEGEEESPRLSPRAFGDPLKIAQYFPELNQ